MNVFLSVALDVGYQKMLGQLSLSGSYTVFHIHNLILLGRSGLPRLHTRSVKGIFVSPSTSIRVINN